MKNFKNKKTLQISLFVLIAVVTLGIGYAAISAINLFINGNATASVNQENFKVYFTQAQSITGSTGVSGTSSIDDNDATIAYFDVSGLTKVGDYGVATYTVLNNSNGIGADITLQLTNSNNEYFKITETVADSQLQAGDDTTATIRVEMIKTPINDSVTTSVTAKLIANPMENASATGSSSASRASDDPESFATDSWATIKAAVHNNNTSAYHVGDTKTVTIGANNYTVRIANKSTAANCGNSDYSETACGFVVEFAEIVEERTMNSENTNIGGWPGSELHTYLEGDFYNSLPSDLKVVIEPTRVISGHGPDDSANFISTNQKLYLLSSVEVFGSDDYDTAAGTTHQLEYYSNNGVTFSTNSWSGTNLDKAVKQYNSSNLWWWLRSAYSNNNIYFRDVDFDGVLCNDTAPNIYGVSPAFRIA